MGLEPYTCKWNFHFHWDRQSSFHCGSWIDDLSVA